MDTNAFIKGFASGLEKKGNVVSGLIGHAIGKHMAPESKGEAKRELMAKESPVLHALLPGYSNYHYARKSTARDLLREKEKKAKGKK